MNHKPWQPGTILFRSIWGRKRRTAFSLLALAVAASTATALLTLGADLESKLTREFRRYGANVIVRASDNGELSQETIAQVRSVLQPADLAVPFAYAVARTQDGDPIVVAGTDFSSLPRLNSWWKVTVWPSGPDSAMAGERARRKLAESGVLLGFHQRNLELKSIATVNTGGPEDSQVFIPLERFTAWTGLRPTMLQVSVGGTNRDIDAGMARIRQAVPGLSVEPVRQVVGTQVKVVESTRSVFGFSAGLIAMLIAFSVLAMMTASVLERRKDFAVMKALGASPHSLVLGFLAEAALIGMAGATLGYFAGTAAAMLIGRVNFQAGIEMRWMVMPEVVAGSVMLALLSAVVPVFILQKVQPAAMLKGE